MGEHELDVRPLPKPAKHPAIFQAYDGLAVGESLVLVNDHDPRHLRDEFEVEHPGGYAWEYVARERGAYRIRISKLAATPLPRVLADAAALGASSGDVTGAVWKLQMRERDLDSNIIALPPGATIGAHGSRRGRADLRACRFRAARHGTGRPYGRAQRRVAHLAAAPLPAPVHGRP